MPSVFDAPSLRLRPASDFHVHLRDGDMMRLVTPTIRQGGVDTVYVMPNLVPPITTVEQALAYRAELQALAPDVTFLMTLYLCPAITPSVIAAAADAGISGVKVYPAGVTTNSAQGVVGLEPFYPVFEAMQERDMVLNLHGEVPSTAVESDLYHAKDGAEGGTAATVLTAEPLFLPTLARLHARFPRLRIILEHCTTTAAVRAVRACGPHVAGTITAHHLYLTTDDVVGEPLNFCKPVAKAPADRVELIRAAFGSGGGDSDGAGISGDGSIDKKTANKFFFGSDSAPHPANRKRPGVADDAPAAAGCFTQRHAVQLVAGAAEEAVRRGWVAEADIAAQLDAFLSGRGRAFYRLEEGERAGAAIINSGGGNPSAKAGTLILENRGEKIDAIIPPAGGGAVQVVPFRRGERVRSLRWEE